MSYRRYFRMAIPAAMTSPRMATVRTHSGAVQGVKALIAASRRMVAAKTNHFSCWRSTLRERRNRTTRLATEPTAANPTSESPTAAG
jgi:hypothetical protein